MDDVFNSHMHDMGAMLHRLQQENVSLENDFKKQLRVARTPIHVPAPVANLVPQGSKEAQVILPDKLDDYHTKL